MATTKLSQQSVERARPKATPYRLWDSRVPGLFLRVQPSGIKSWNVQWSRQSSKSLGKFPGITLDAARVQARAMLAEADKDGAPATVVERRKRGTLTLGDFVRDDYGPHVLATHKSGAATVAQLKRLFPHLFPKPLTAITPAVFDKWRAQRLRDGVKPATVNRDLDYLKAALGQAKKWGKLDSNPLAGVERIKRGIEQRTRYLTDDEEEALRDALAQREAQAREQRKNYNAWREQRGIEPLPEIKGYSDHLMPLALLALNTGLRRGELLGLTWADIDLDGKRLTVRAATAKSGKTRHVPLNSEALAVLEQWKRQHPDGRLFTSKPSTHTWPRLMETAGIENFRFHDLRHTFASRLVMKGVDLNTVRELLGHADITMTLRYAHLAPEHKAAAVELLTAKPESAKKPSKRRSRVS